MAAREREAEAHRVEAERLRAHLASLQREAAALRAVGGDDDQCARSRPAALLLLALTVDAFSEHERVDSST